MPIRPALALILALALAGCALEPQGPIDVSVIGDEPELADPSQRPPTTGSGILLNAVAQGLVAFDAQGQIEPALAERWVIADGGLSYIFRLKKDAQWGGRTPLTAKDLVAPIRAAMNPGGQNRMRRLLAGIEEVNAITPQILELRLRGPRPNLLALLAQPDMAMIRRKSGSGPLRVSRTTGKGIALIPADHEGPDSEVADSARVNLHGDRAALAVARFKSGKAQLVLGGRYQDLLLTSAAAIDRRYIRFDPADGLFGLRVEHADGFLRLADNRRAISMAIDRVAMVNAIGAQSWRPQHTLLPGELNGGRVPVEPGWTGLSMANRIAVARSRVQQWMAEGNDRPRLAIALPDGPGSTILFARLALDLAQIGVVAERAGQRGRADLRLIDRVADNDSIAWYLDTVDCTTSDACGEDARDAIAAASDARSIGERRAAFNTAEEQLMIDMPFIPLAQPLRWSLVMPQLTGFRDNSRATHPLNQLRRAPN